jgi:hypothetical protein
MMMKKKKKKKKMTMMIILQGIGHSQPVPVQNFNF